jgi:hypothetical protein
MLALFPSALEQCRIACLSPSAPATEAVSFHSCHEVPASDPNQTQINSGTNVCKHRSSSGLGDPPRIATAKYRSAATVVVLAASPCLQVATISHGRDFMHGPARPRLDSSSLTLSLRL